MDKERAEFLSRNEAATLDQSPQLRPLRERLLALGGRWTLMPVIEEDLAKLLKRGEAQHGTPIMRRGEPSRCHKNSSDLWDANKEIVEVMTGYALSRDGIWRQHTWCWWAARGKVVETTDARILYYGYRLTPREAEQFWVDNAL
jgi:hypothetical protein